MSGFLRGEPRASTLRRKKPEKRKRGASLRDLLRWKNQLKTHDHDYQKNERHAPPRLCRERGKSLEAAQQVPPRWHRLHHPEPQNAQVRLRQNEQGDRNPELRIEERAEVWRHVAQQESRGCAAGGASE